ncbi:MAG TPA: phosphotransferase [Thermoanaerobaculia bacterium]
MDSRAMGWADMDLPEPPGETNALDSSLANWRVLLPEPGGGTLSHLVLLGGPDDLERLIIPMGVAERVSRSLPPARLADAAVVLGDATPSLRQVTGCLRPGGWLYWEIQRQGVALLHRTAGSVLKDLRMAGLSPTGLYWVRPQSGPPTVFVPLDARGAVAWYLDTFGSVSIGAIAARFPRSSRALARATVGRIAVTAVAQEGAAPKPSLLGHSGLPEPLRSSPSHPLVFFREHSRRAVIFPFAAGGTVPEAVLKFSPVRERGPRTGQEQQTLSEIRARLDPAMRRSVPEPLALLEWSGLTVGVESFLTGRSIGRAVSLPGVPLSRKLADLDRVTAWLCRFQLENSFGRPAWGSEVWSLDEWVEEPFRLFEREFVLRPEEERLFAAARRAARALVGTPLPLVLSNWSFSTGNVCRSAEGIGVYDWETITRGLPLADLLYFLIDWSRLMRRDLASSWRKTFVGLLIEPPRGRVIRAVQRSIARYLAELEIDPRFHPLLYVLTWVQRAERRFRKDGLVRRSLDPRLRALAEAADGLFAGDQNAY